MSTLLSVYVLVGEKEFLHLLLCLFGSSVWAPSVFYVMLVSGFYFY